MLPGEVTNDHLTAGQRGRTEDATGSDRRLGPLWALLPLLATSVLLTAAAAGPGVLPGDVVMARALQMVAVSGATDLARFTNWLGAGPQLTILAIAVVIMLVVVHRFAAAGLIVAVTLARTLSPLIKTIAASPRPTADLVQISEHVSNPGFPSGHVLGATLFYGAIAYLAHDQIRHGYARRLVQALAMCMVLATGFGRIATGAHWPSDVLGGYLWGATLLLVLVSVYRSVGRRSRNEGHTSRNNALHGGTE